MDSDQIRAQLETLDGAKKDITIKYPPPPELRFPIVRRTEMEQRVYEFVGYSSSGTIAKYKERS